MTALLAQRKPFWQNAAVWLATGLGLGYSPVAPGTVGSLWGLMIVVYVNSSFGVAGQIVVGLLLTAAAIPLCDIAEKHFGTKDDHRIVADEYLTFSICMIGLPLTPWVIGMAFVVNRMFDIIKPPPARGLQNIHGGLGIVIDDFLACLYALATNHLIFRLVGLVRAHS